MIFYLSLLWVCIYCWNMEWRLNDVELCWLQILSCAPHINQNTEEKRDQKCTDKSTTVFNIWNDVERWLLSITHFDGSSHFLMRKSNTSETSNGVISSPRAMNSKCFALCFFIFYSVKANTKIELTYTTRCNSCAHQFNFSYNLFKVGGFSLVWLLTLWFFGFGFCWTHVLSHFSEKVFFFWSFWRVRFRATYEIQINFRHL